MTSGTSYGPLAGCYDGFTGDVPYGEFLSFYEKIFAQRGKCVSSVLDMACGTGTLTCMMAEKGYDMTAVDASPDMLAIAGEKAEGLEKSETRPLFLCQELSELDLYGTVDCAVSSLDGMNYIPPEELPEIFRRLHLFVEREGLLIFDINSPSRLRELSGQAFVDEKDDVLCLWRAEFDEEENALFYGMDIFTSRGELWERQSEEHVEYAHSPLELVELLEGAGFEHVEIISDGPQCEIGRLFIAAENGKD